MTIHPLRLAVAALPVLAVLAPWTGAQAVASPDFTATATAYDVDTTAMTITGTGASYTGTDEGGTAVFSFGSVDIPAGATLTVHGSRPFELAAATTLSMAGAISANGTDSQVGAAAPGGPGAGAGGAPTMPGSGPGAGGLAGTDDSGGGGAGFGGAGAAGGSPGSGGGAGGTTYGDLTQGLVGGSGSAGDHENYQGGAGGGGAVELSAADLTVTGSVTADGGSGFISAGGATAGGSGGGVILHGGNVTFLGSISVQGGTGGLGGCCGDGGGGGGGRVLFDWHDSLTNHGSLNDGGGASGSAPDDPFSSHAYPSPQANGDYGSIDEHHYDVPPAGPDTSSASIHAGFASITYGRKVAVSTVLTDTTTSTPIGGASVDLYRRTSPDGAWSLVGSRTTTSTGRAGIAVTPTATSDYQWRYAGQVLTPVRATSAPADHDAATSDNATVRVVQFVYSHVTDGSVTHSAAAAYHVYGWVQPAGTGQRVYLQRRSGTSWVAVTNQVLKNQKLPSGTTRVGYNFTVRAPKAGTFTYRVYKPATTTLDKAYSAAVTFTVK